MEAKLTTTEALNKVLTAKGGKAPTAASAQAKINEIMGTDDMDAKETALIELAQSLNAMSINGSGPPSFYYVATEVTSELSGDPILYSGASKTFVTGNEYLTNTRKHETPIATANGRSSFEKSAGKYKLKNTATFIYVSALSAPNFTQNLISAGQLAHKHSFLFTKDGYYLQDSSAPPPATGLIGFRGAEDLYRLRGAANPKKEKEKEESAAPALAPVVNDISLHNTLNHSSLEKLAWFQREYPEAI